MHEKRPMYVPKCILAQGAIAEVFSTLSGVTYHPEPHGEPKGPWNFCYVSVENMKSHKINF